MAADRLPSWLLLLVACLVVADLAAAQAPGDVPVLEVRVVGNRTIPTARIVAQLQTRTGRPFRSDLVGRDVRKLASLGWFLDVKPLYEDVPGGRVVIFQVVERPKLEYVRFVGNESVKEKNLLKQVDLKEGESLDPYSVEEGRRKLEQFYRDRGYSKVQVKVQEGTQPGDRGAVYAINEGPVQRIWRARFVGNTIASDARLKTQIKSKPGWFWVIKGYVDKKQIDADIDRLTAYYRSLGFFRARVGRELDFNEEGTWLTLTFVIDEGPRYRVRNVAFLGESRLKKEALTADLKLQAGQYFDQAAMTHDLALLRDAYGSQGYVFADVQAEPRFLEEPGQLDLVYNIDQGEQYRVGRINVKIGGENPHTRRQTVLNRLSFKPGDIVDIREIRRSERRLKASGLFLSDPLKGGGPRIVFDVPDVTERQLARQPRGSNSRGQSPDPPAVDLRVVTPPLTPTGETGANGSATLPPPALGAGSRQVRGQSPSPYPTTSTPYGGQPVQQLEPGGTAYPTTAAGGAARYPVTAYPQTRYPVTGGATPSTPGRYPASAPNPVPIQPRATVRPPTTVEPPVAGVYPSTGYPAAGYPPTAGSAAGTAGAVYPSRAPYPSTTTEPAAYPPINRPLLGQPAAPPRLNQGVQVMPQPYYEQPPDAVPLGVAPQPLDFGVFVDETQTGRFMLGVGVNSDAGVIGSITIDEQNFDWRRWPRSFEDFRNGTAFRGAGQRFRLELLPGSEVQRYMMNFQEPYLFDTNVSLGLSAFYYDRRYTDWDEQRVGGRVSLGYQLRPDLAATVSYRGENVNLHDPVVPTPPELAASLGDNSLHGFKVALTNDTRDSTFLATQGYYLEMSFEQVIGSYTYPRGTVDLRRYFLVRQRPDGSGRHVVSTTGRLGFTGSDTPIYDNFFAGGFSTIRGFEFRGIGPRTFDVPVGGEFMMLGSVEYLFPITADDMLRAVAFCDFGTVERSVTIRDFRVAPGFGFRVTVPALGPAPIALDFAFPVNKGPGDDTQVFSFNVGFLR